MTRDEMRDCLKLIQANYENWRPSDMTVTLNLWAESFKDDPAELVKAAIWAIIQTSTADFAPKVGQVRAKMLSMQSTEITDAEAWVQVYKAICNANYHADAEFAKLPADVQRAVGGADQLRAWAVMDEESMTVAESNFKRSYRAAVNKRKELEALPVNLRPQIPVAPVAQIESNETRQSWDEFIRRDKADPDKVAEMLSDWRSDMERP